MADRFPTPFEIQTPPGAEGWEELYPYSSVFSEDRRDYEESQFWFQDGVHLPSVMPPWDATMYEFAFAALGQNNHRHYRVPPAKGVDFRTLNGYAYLGPVTVDDPAEIEARVPEFMERAGYYYENWDELYGRWMVKIRELIDEIEALQFEPLPEVEPLETITSGAGIGSGYYLIENYHRLLDHTLKLWNYHFEFLNLGYAAYLDFFQFCKQAFPGIPDQSIAKMVAGIEVDLFRPDQEVKKLAELAVELDMDEAFRAGSPEAVLEAVRAHPGGKRWMEAFEAAKQPWFNFSGGSGFYSADKIWIENLELPFEFIDGYIGKLRRGESLQRPLEEIEAERDRLVTEYSALLGSDEDRQAFDAKLGLARTVFPYVENHNFYVEHWSHSVIWRKMRDIGAILVKEGFFAEADDIFCLKRDEVPEALFDMYAAWGVGIEPRGPKYWPPEIARRKGILDALRQWSPPRCLGAPPESITEPFTVMLWGTTTDAVTSWLGAESGSTDGITGMAASPGCVEGSARVIISADGIGEIQPGEVLVAPLTAPSWAPVFGKIAATVTDVGGIMSHAAIVCREYGLPAVTGTAYATRDIKTGQRLRVDGNTGQITVLD
jgi:pyruvate,water dikinase